MILRALSLSCFPLYRQPLHLRLLHPRFYKCISVTGNDGQCLSTADLCTRLLTSSVNFNTTKKQTKIHSWCYTLSNYQLVQRAPYCTQNKPDGNQPTKERFENVMTVPNVLTVSRMVMCPILGYLVVQGDYPTAFGLFLIAGITDLLDGWIARTFPSQASLAGSFLDPLADKLLIGTLFITLTVSGLIPVPLTALIVARDCLLVASAFGIRYVSLPPPKTLRRYFDVTLVSAQLAPTGISKFNTAVQLLLVATTLGASAADYLSNPILPFLWYATGTTTVLSGLSYVFAKNTYRIMSRSRAK